MILSIIVPVYNGEKYIIECMDSLFQSTSEEYEVIAVNDGSKDGSRKLLDEYARKETRLKVIHKENGGVSSTRNRGLEEAKGTHITFVDVDDLLEEHAIDAILDSCKKNPLADFFIGNYVEVSEKNEILWNFPIADRIAEDKLKLDHELLCGYLLNACWGKVYRKSLIDELGLRFDSQMKMGEDLKFVAEYCRYVKALTGIHQVIYRYRQLSTGAVLNNRNKLDEANINDFVKTMECKISYAQSVSASQEDTIGMYQEFANNISASLNLMLQTDISKKDKKKKAAAFMNHPRIKDAMIHVMHSKACGMKRKLMGYLVLHRTTRNLYVELKSRQASILRIK